MEQELEAVFREERARALATLIRLLRDFDLAEDALQEAFLLAAEEWRAGVPRHPRAWLVSVARHKAIDRLRRARNFEAKRAQIAWLSEGSIPGPDVPADSFPDDRLRLIFTCCHPALAPEAQIALTLRTLCGLSVEEIARAFLVAPTAMAQRLVRAKGKIRDAGIPYEVPEPSQVAERLQAVLRVVYLVFNEGYAATSGDALVRRELCTEAIRLGRLMRALLPEAPEAAGLLALMLLQDSRRAARLDEAGELVTLQDQDRSRWDHEEVAEGLRLAEWALRRGGAGFYAIQAAIGALHAQAARAEDTDWPQISALYSLLLRVHPSPVVALNHAAAVSMEQPERGLRMMEEIEKATRELDAYFLLPAAKADVLRRLGRREAAASCYEDALRLVTHDAERRYLQRRLQEVRRAG
jgi:RNA polymerase sigma-70 factor (ECF subfamily)